MFVVRPDGRGADAAQFAGHPVDVPLRGVDVEHEGGRDQLLPPPPDGLPVLAHDPVTTLGQQRRGVWHQDLL